jgi:hypothetical protein
MPTSADEPGESWAVGGSNAPASLGADRRPHRCGTLDSRTRPQRGAPRSQRPWVSANLVHIELVQVLREAGWPVEHEDYSGM